MDYALLKSTILSVDLPLLSGEHAALLLNFIPTEDELDQLNKLKPQKEKFVRRIACVFLLRSVLLTKILN